MQVEGIKKTIITSFINNIIFLEVPKTLVQMLVCLEPQILGID